MRGGGTFTLVVSDGGASTETLILVWVEVVGPSVGDAVTALTRMQMAATLFLWMSTHLDMQPTALLQAQNIQSKVILYVANSSDQQFTLLVVFFPLRNFCKGLWSLRTRISQPQR